MESNNNIFKALAVLVVIYLTGSFWLTFAVEIATHSFRYFWRTNLLMFIVLVFHWIAVLKADKSTVWAVILLIISILFVLPGIFELRSLVIIFGTIYFIYSIVSLVKISYKSHRRVR
ncbi:hypothetical protein RJG79_04900 [Mycoplasmatota bacterium WC44]